MKAEMFSCVNCYQKLAEGPDGLICTNCGLRCQGPFPKRIEKPIFFIIRDPETGQENFLNYKTNNGDLVTALGTSVVWAKKNYPKFEEFLKGSGLELRAIRFSSPEVLIGPETKK